MKIYITDKTAKQFWRTDITGGFAQGERNNLAQRLRRIKVGDPAYGFVDRVSAQIVEEAEDEEMSDDELVAALTSD